MLFLDIPEIGGYFNNFLDSRSISTYKDVSKSFEQNLQTYGQENVEVDELSFDVLRWLTNIGMGVRKMKIRYESSFSLLWTAILSAIPELRDLTLPHFSPKMDLPKSLEYLEIQHLVCHSTSIEQVFDFSHLKRLQKIVIHSSGSRKPAPFQVILPKTIEVVSVGQNVSLDYTVLFSPRLQILKVEHLRNIPEGEHLRIPSRCLEILDLGCGIAKNISFSSDVLVNVRLFCTNKTEVDKYLMGLFTLQYADINQMYVVPEDPPLNNGEQWIVVQAPDGSPIMVQERDTWRRIRVHNYRSIFKSNA
jgi:hypothetical protein